MRKEEGGAVKENGERNGEGRVGKKTEKDDKKRKERRRSSSSSSRDNKGEIHGNKKGWGHFDLQQTTTMSPQ